MIKLFAIMSAILVSSFAFGKSVPGEYLIVVHDGSTLTKSLTEDTFGLAAKSFKQVVPNVFKVTTDSKVDLSQVNKSITGYTIQPNYIYGLFPTPKVPLLNNKADDPNMSDQWGLNNSNVQQIWEVTKGDPNIVVGVLDTGVQWSHEDLRANIWVNEDEIAGNGIDDDQNGYIDDVRGWDFAADDNDPDDPMSAGRIDGNPGHGTHCAGVIGAAGGNGIGISGVAPETTIMPLRFITEEGQGTTEDAIEGIRYGVDNGAQIISNSWGGEEDRNAPDVALQEAIQYALDNNVLMLVASGNGRNGAGFNNDTDPNHIVPASYDHDNIISVAAIGQSDGLAAFSNYGTESVDIGAPGEQIMSTVPTESGYEDQIMISLFGVFELPVAPWSGTSMATPHVAGAAALILALKPDATYGEVRDILLNNVRTTTSMSSNVGTGGVLDVESAINWIVD